VALCLVAAEPQQQLELLQRFGAFRHDLEPQAVRRRDRAFDDVTSPASAGSSPMNDLAIFSARQRVFFRRVSDA